MHNPIDASRNFGVDSKGMALLLAFALQAMQAARSRTNSAPETGITE